AGSTMNTFFGRISVKKNDRKYQSIKYYQFTDPELINQEHYNINFDSKSFQKYNQQDDNN
ncbi:3664_t:CDS:1, partial [Funneliformis caledonium]